MVSVLAVLGAACGDEGGVELIEPTDAVTSTTAGQVATTASVAEAATTPGVLLFDDFQDGDAAGWEIDSGWYVLGRADRLVLSAGDEAWAWWPGGADWDSRYVVRASVRFDSGGVAVSAAVGDEGRYVVHLHEDGTYLLRDRPWGNFETLAEAPAVAPGMWHALAFGVEGGRLLVFVDGQRTLEFEDPAPLSGGSVGFGATTGSVVAVDDVLVTVLGTSLPDVAAASPPAQGDSPDPGPADDPLDPGDEGDEGDGGDGNGDEPTSDEQDFSIVSVVFDNALPAAGEAIGVTIRISNDSDLDGEPVGVAFAVGDVGCSVVIGSLTPHTETNAPCSTGGLPAGTYEWTAHVDHDERTPESDELDNIRTGVIDIAADQPDYPNLGVWSAEFDPDMPADGEPFGMRVAVADLAPGFEGAIPSYTVRVEAGGVVWCSGEASGPSAVVTCDHPGLPGGDYQYVVVVDADDDVDEGPNGEVDNTLRGFLHVSGTIVVHETISLSVGRVMFDPPVPVAGEEFEVRVDVAIGPRLDIEIPDFTVRFSVAGNPACEWGVNSIDPNYCTWRLDTPGTYRWDVRVDATNTVDEGPQGEANNDRTGTIEVSP